MIENFVELMTNPKIAKIFIEINKYERISAKQLAEVLTDIPTPSLYRYLQKLYQGGILDIVEEIPNRGAVEKIYAVSEKLKISQEKMIKESDGSSYMLMFIQYITGIMADFQEYTARSDINLMEDGSGFNITPIYANLKELVEAHIKIQKIIEPLALNQPDGVRKLHNFCTITTPPKENKK